MYIQKIKKIIILSITILTMVGCDLSLQQDYDYQSSVIDPHVKMTAWDYLQTRPDIFSKLIQAIEYTDMKHYYTQTDTVYTFLALTNTALTGYITAQFPGKTLISDCDKELVRNMLLYHIVDGNYSSYGNLMIEPMFVITLLKGEQGLMTMLVRKNPWQSDAGKITINSTGSNGNSPMVQAVTSNIFPTNGVIHVFDSYCYYKK